jgi:hypothetical protein
MAKPTQKKKLIYTVHDVARVLGVTPGRIREALDRDDTLWHQVAAYRVILADMIPAVKAEIMASTARRRNWPKKKPSEAVAV